MTKNLLFYTRINKNIQIKQIKTKQNKRKEERKKKKTWLNLKLATFNVNQKGKLV